MTGWRRWVVGLGVLAVSSTYTLLSMATVGASPTRSSADRVLGSTRSTQGSTATWAEDVASPPNWILPFTPIAYFSIANTAQFEQLLYRPLYWMGNAAGEPVVDESLSIGQAPHWSNGDKTVTVDLKHYKWSNGTTVDARDVVFFVNMAKAEKVNLAAYAPGEFPDDVVSVTARSATATTVTFHLNQAYNPMWFTANQLSVITPLPIAWDVTGFGPGGGLAAPGSGGCSISSWSRTVQRACARVWGFLSEQSMDLTTYATNPLWKVVDGPWSLSTFAVTGRATFVPNPTYSGPVRPTFSRFVEVPFATPGEEFAALAKGTMSVGYVSIGAVPPAPAPGEVGPNNPKLAARYDLGLGALWGISYFPINFNSTGDRGAAGALFRQLYIRRAIQRLVDQPALNASANLDRNYGTPTYGPVPIAPANPYVDKVERNNPLPYDPFAAVASLKSHGWTIVPGGVDHSAAAAGCGAGIPLGTALAFNLIYASGNQMLTGTIAAEVSSWSRAGIDIVAKAETFNQVIATATPCTGGPQCTWEMADWGGGWIYSPDVYPSGEMLFSPGAGSNSGSYDDPTAAALVNATLHSATPDVVDLYENYLAVQAPVIWQPEIPEPGFALLEVAKGLTGVLPANPLGTLTPEDWR